MSFLDDLVSVNISATTRTVSRTGFGTPLFATYHQRFADRVRSYADLEGMRADGFQSDEPAYLMAAAAWSQSPRPSAIKIGRRASAFSQVLNINVPASPLGGDIFSATVDGIDCTYTASSSTSQGSVCTGAPWPLIWRRCAPSPPSTPQPWTAMPCARRIWRPYRRR